jgi:hypothetical protein
MKWVAVSVAGLLALIGLRVLARAMREEFEPANAWEVVAYSLYLTARIGLWVALAALLAGKALLDHPNRFNWFAMVPISLAGLQLLTGLYLSRSPGGSPGPRWPRREERGRRNE